jgi:hypothetical protein
MLASPRGYDHPTWTFCQTVASKDPLDISRGFIRLLMEHLSPRVKSVDGEGKFPALHDVSGMTVGQRGGTLSDLELISRIVTTMPSEPTTVWMNSVWGVREMNLKEVFLSLLGQIEHLPIKKK